MNVIPFPTERWHVPFVRAAVWLGCPHPGCVEMCGGDSIDEATRELEQHVQADHGPKEAA